MVGIGISPLVSACLHDRRARARRSAGLELPRRPDRRDRPDAGHTSSSRPSGSPDDTAFSPDGRLLFVGHKRPRARRLVPLDNATGALVPTGNVFQVGDTLSQGELEHLGDLLFVLDESSTATLPRHYTLRYTPAGTMSVIDQDLTGGNRPMDLAVWQGIPEPSMLGLVGAGALMLMRRKRADIARNSRQRSARAAVGSFRQA